MKFGVGILRVYLFSEPEFCEIRLSELHTPSKSVNVYLFSEPEFCENRLSELHTPSKSVNEFCVRTTHVSWPIVVKFCVTNVHRDLHNDNNFCENWHREKPHFTQGRKCISVRTCHSYCPIWVKFGTRHIMLLSFSEFRDNRRREGCTCLTGVSEITSTCAP
jgi:hypothetical protein